jgi:hypothetical protein
VLLALEAVPAVAKLLRCHRRRVAPANSFQKSLSPRPEALPSRRRHAHEPPRPQGHPDPVPAL